MYPTTARVDSASDSARWSWGPATLQSRGGRRPSAAYHSTLSPGARPSFARAASSGGNDRERAAERSSADTVPASPYGTHPSGTGSAGAWYLRTTEPSRSTASVSGSQSRRVGGAFPYSSAHWVASRQSRRDADCESSHTSSAKTRPSSTAGAPRSFVTAMTSNASSAAAQHTQRSIATTPSSIKGANAAAAPRRRKPSWTGATPPVSHASTAVSSCSLGSRRSVTVAPSRQELATTSVAQTDDCQF